MKSTFLYICLFILCLPFVGQQNLVPNPSFEEYWNCPSTNEFGNGQFTLCKYWWYPTPSSIGTPDYFNVCNNNDPFTPSLVGVPNNFNGVQDAYEGSGYIDFAPFSYYLNGEYKMQEIELVSTKLISKLKSCHKYRFTMYLSLCENSTHSLSELGISLTSDSVVYNSVYEVHQIEPVWTNSVLLDDTINWMKVEGEFIADGFEEYLTIGYFEELDTNQLVLNNPMVIDVTSFFLPYYYVDNVSLIDIGLVSKCESNLGYIFTPNGDGVNDSFKLSDFSCSNVYIYNRWGNLITKLNERNISWSGLCNSRECSEGVYFYVGEDASGNSITKGTIQLIR